MLYLNNAASTIRCWFIKDLTLTSVVFEFACLIGTAIAKANLTLTSVVFECF